MPAPDTDTDVLADEASNASTGNPLRDALSHLRADAGDTESPQDEVEENEVADDEEEPLEDGDDVAVEDDTEAEDDVPADDDESDDEPEPKTTKQAKLSRVEILMPNADGSKGPRGQGKITLEGVPQEAADAIRHYQKQADRLPLIEEQLATAQEGQQIADFIESDPFAAMVVLNQARPEAVDEFVETWMRMNAKRLPEFIEKLDMADLDEKHMRIESKLARQEAEEKARKSLGTHREQFQFKRQADALLLTAQNVAKTAGLSGDDQEEFMFVASRKMAKLYKDNPNLTSREVIAALQPTVAKYVGSPPKSQPKDKTKNAAQVFSAKVLKAKKYSVVGTGKGSVKATSTGNRPPRGTSTLDAIRGVKSGKYGV